MHGVGGEGTRAWADGDAGRAHRLTLATSFPAGPGGAPGATAVCFNGDAARGSGEPMIVQFNIRDFLDRAELAYPDRVGLLDEPDQPAASWEPMTFGELAAAAARPGGRSRPAGCRRGRACGGGLAQLLPPAHLFLRGLAWGRILVPVNFRLSAAEVGYIVDHAGALGVLVDPGLDDALAEVRAPHRFVLGAESDPVLFPEGCEPRSWESDEGATATINYTSGTTARPKGVQLTHRNCWVNAAVFGWHVQLSDRDVYLHTLPMFHANGWGVPWAAVAMACPQVALRKVDGTEILRRIERHGVTLLCAAPAVVNAVLDALATWDGAVPGRDVTRIVVAGAPPPSRTIERIESELGWEFIQLYGLTETAPVLTFNRSRPEWDDLSSAERARKLVRAGAPAVGTEVRIDAEPARCSPVRTR